MTYSMMVFRRSVFLLSTLCFLLEVGAQDRVGDITLPVCRVLNANLDCPIPCWGNKWEVTLLMTGHNGAKVHPDIKIYGTVLNEPDNIPNLGTFNDAPEENATLFTYTTSCCRASVEIAAVDEHGNRGLCNFTIRRPTTKVTDEIEHKDQSVHANSPNITISLWTTSLLLALAALLL